MLGYAAHYVFSSLLSISNRCMDCSWTMLNNDLGQETLTVVAQGFLAPGGTDHFGASSPHLPLEVGPLKPS